MVRIFFILPLAFVLVLFPHLIVGHNARSIKLGEVPEGPSSYVEIPNMHQIGTPESQQNKPNFETQPPSSSDTSSAQTQGQSQGQGQNSQAGTQSQGQGQGQGQNSQAGTESQGQGQGQGQNSQAGTESQGQGQGQGQNSQAESQGQGQNTQTQTQTQGGGQANSMIEQACEPTQFKQLCIDNLKSEPMSANADMKSLAFISLNVTKNDANEISEWLYNQLDDPELAPGVQQAYTDCAEQYTDAVAQVEDSMLAFFANALNDIEVWMNVAIGNAQTCEENLKAGNGVQAMGNKNEVFKQQCTNSLAIITRLMKQM